MKKTICLIINQRGQTRVSKTSDYWHSFLSRGTCNKKIISYETLLANCQLPSRRAVYHMYFLLVSIWLNLRWWPVIRLCAIVPNWKQWQVLTSDQNVLFAFSQCPVTPNCYPPIDQPEKKAMYDLHCKVFTPKWGLRNSEWLVLVLLWFQP